MKIFWISSSPFARNGFGTQAHVAMRGLGLAGHDVRLVAMHRPQEAYSVVWEFSDGRTIQTDARVDFTDLGAKRLYSIYPHGVHPNGGMFGDRMLEQLLSETRPDLICTLHDTQNVSFMQHIPVNLGIPWVHWFPWDNAIWEPEMGKFLMESQAQVVLMSDFAEKLCKEARFPYVGKIYHGVNTQVYKPLDKHECRKALGFEAPEIGTPGIFQVGYIGQNEERKHIDLLLKAFSIFAKNHANVRLFMHTDVEESYPAHWAYRVLHILQRENADERFKHSPRARFLSKFTDKTMAELYNSQDVLLSTTSGEGFGLMALYGNACGVPSITSGVNTGPQLTGEGEWGWLIPMATMYEAPGGYTRGMVNIAETVRLLEHVYQNPDEVHKKGELARRDSLKYDQNIIGKQWADLVAKL